MQIKIRILLAAALLALPIPFLATPLAMASAAAPSITLAYLPLKAGHSFTFYVDGLPAACFDPDNWPGVSRATLAGQNLALDSINGDPGSGTLNIESTVPGNQRPGLAVLTFFCNQGSGFQEMASANSYVQWAGPNASAGYPDSEIRLFGYYLPALCSDSGGQPWPESIGAYWDDVRQPWLRFSGNRQAIEGKTYTFFDGYLKPPAGAALGRHTISLWCGTGGGFAPRAMVLEPFLEWPYDLVAPIPADPPTPPAPVPPAPAPPAPAPAPASVPAPALASTEPSPATVSTATGSSSASPSPAVIAGAPSLSDSGWPRTGNVAALPQTFHLDRVLSRGGCLLLIVGLLLFLLAGWPAELFNKTFEENEPVIRRWLRLNPAKPIRARASSWPVVALFTTVSAAVMSIADPGPLFTRDTLVTALALLVAVPVTAVAFELSIESYSRRHAPDRPKGKLRVVFPALAVAAVCAVFSHVLGFVPGYAYGLILGFTVVERSLSRPQEARGVLRGVLVMLALGAFAWAAWRVGFAQSAAGPATSFPVRLADTILGYLAMMSLEVLVIVLLPLRFLHGAKLWNAYPGWRGRLLWLGVHSVVVTGFLIVLLGLGERTPSWPEFIRMLILLLSFCFGSLTFWAFFAARAKVLARAH